MPTYTEGICQDGAAILKDGEMVTIGEILKTLNEATESSAPSGQAEYPCYVLSCTTGRKLRATIECKSRLRKLLLLPWLMVAYEGTNLSGPCICVNWMRPGKIVGYTDNT